MEKQFTQAQVDLALRKEQLILRLEQGESLEAVSQELDLTYHPKHVSRLQRWYTEGGRHWTALVDQRMGGSPTKISDEIMEWMREEIQRNPEVAVSYLCNQIQAKFKVEVHIGHVRRVARDLGREGRRGRPRQKTSAMAELPHIEQTQYAGIFFPTGRAVAHGDYAGNEASPREV
jgi:transposase